MNSNSEAKRRHYQKHKDEILLKRKARYASNPTHYRQKQREWVEQSPEKFLGALVRQITKRNRLKPIYTKAGKKYTPIIGAKTIVEIDYDYVWNLWGQQNGKCAITNLPMSHRYGKLTTVSIDRIDSTRGYVSGNIQLTCQGANLLKNERSNFQTRRFILEAAVQLFQDDNAFADPSSPHYDWATRGRDEFLKLREAVYLAHGKRPYTRTDGN